MDLLELQESRSVDNSFHLCGSVTNNSFFFAVIVSVVY